MRVSERKCRREEREREKMRVRERECVLEQGRECMGETLSQGEL